MTQFLGFGQQTIGFLAGLSEHNSKAWFDAHRAEYETHYLTPAIAFIEAIAPALDAMAPGIHVEPKVNGSIFRINRDVRFSKDKTPYKDHLDLWFWEGERKQPRSALFFRLTKDELLLGAGVHGFTPGQLAAYRAALGDPARSTALLAIEAGLAGAGLTLEGEHYRTVPRGMDPADPALARLSKFNALHAVHRAGHPAELGSARFADYCVGKWRPTMPLHRWLTALA